MFYPTYQLGTVRIAREPEGVAVEYRTVKKPSPAEDELTLTERLFTVGREPELDIPERTLIDSGEVVSTGSKSEDGGESPTEAHADDVVEVDDAEPISR